MAFQVSQVWNTWSRELNSYSVTCQNIFYRPLTLLSLCLMSNCYFELCCCAIQSVLLLWHLSTSRSPELMSWNFSQWITAHQDHGNVYCVSHSVTAIGILYWETIDIFNRLQDLLHVICDLLDFAIRNRAPCHRHVSYFARQFNFSLWSSLSAAKRV